MSSMELYLEEGHTKTEKCVRPVGPWRFLTPMETIQTGDLIRIVNRGVNQTPYDANWSLISEKGDGDSFAGLTYMDIPYLEVIRPYDSTAFTVPLFKEKGE